jgi:bifunctional DNA-binding transcriptional regulator/antitoxin component of YhaV-PrlF toxin-antitoxin module
MGRDKVATVEIEVKLNEKNELTLPDEVMERLRLEPGNRLVIAYEDEGPDRIQVRPIRRSYAGILTGMFGTDEEALEYVRAERASWGQ